MTKTQTTNDKPHNARFSGARLLAPVLFGAVAMMLAAGGAGAAADNNAFDNTSGVDAPAADSLRFRSLALGDGTFADMRRQMQLRVLSQWEDAISHKAEGALTKEFSAVKKADIYLQTNTGGRKGHLGAHVVGALTEEANSAFGWQLRAYAAEDSAKGANAGLFIRTVGSGVLLGGNLFADYESGDMGDFFRYGIGAEAQNRFFAIAANYYLPVSDDKTKGATVAFSRKGYDANLRMNIPHLSFAKVRADYYRFDGKHGAKEESGFRYGMELHPLAGLRLGVFFDDGAQDVGGDISYSYTIGESLVRHNDDNGFFAPDLFAPVSREYSQRIATVTVGPQVIDRISSSTLTGTRTIAYLSPVTTTLSSAANIHASIHYMGGDSNTDGVTDEWVFITRERVRVILPHALPDTPYQIVFGAEANLAAVTMEVIQSNHNLIPVGRVGAMLIANEQAPFTATLRREDGFGPQFIAEDEVLQTIITQMERVEPTTTTLSATTRITLTESASANPAMTDMPNIPITRIAIAPRHNPPSPSPSVIPRPIIPSFPRFFSS